MKLHRQEH